jgi:RimJ/RimL family protein N-acetyltransferase
VLVLAVLRLGFAELGLHRVVGRCDACNTASAKVVERLGALRGALPAQRDLQGRVE